MKRLLTFALTGALLTGCLYNYGSDKPLTGQIPSTDKFKLEGTKISSRAMKPADDGTFAVWQRLYDTTWYQTEKEFEIRNIKEDNPTTEELRDWWKKSGQPLKKLFNTSGKLYKEMHLKERLPQMSEEEQLSLLGTDGMLVKRPILVDGDRVLIGFREKEWEELEQ